MSFARILLHAAALLLPLIALDFAFALLHGGLSWEQLTPSVCAVAAAQLAALPGWALLERCARRPGRLAPALVGLGMGLLTHGVFGLLAVFAGVMPSPAGQALVPEVWAYSVWSLLLVGWLTLPLLAALSVLLHGVRREELALPAGA